MVMPPKEKQRLHLYIVVFSYVTSFYSILPMIPYFSIERKIKGIMYALSFSGYYLTQLLSFLYFGSVSDRIGRRNTLLISLFGQTICNFLCFYVQNVYVYIFFRFVTGIFDCTISIAQAYITDVSLPGDRTNCLSKLEAVVNAGQCVGPLIAGIISKWSVIYAIYFGIVVEFVGLLYAIFYLPESVEAVLEKRKLQNTFRMVRKVNQRYHIVLRLYIGGMNDQLLLEANQEVEQIERRVLGELRQKEKNKFLDAKLEINYLIVIAIVCEFCNKFVFSLFDIIVCLFGNDKFQLSSMEFGLLSTVGSAVNIFQTGFLFSWLVDKKQFSIPTVGSFAGVFGAAACILCVYSNRVWYLIGATTIIVAYGFYAPVAPSILSAESTDATHGKALSLVQVGGQIAYIISPFLLERLYVQSRDLPFYISLIPSIILSVVMFMCIYLPGGRMAGQISLQASLENDAKMGIMNEDNEWESENLGSTADLISNNNKDEKKRRNRLSANRQMEIIPTAARFDIEPSSLPDDDPPESYTSSLARLPSVRYGNNDDDMEI